MQRNVEFYCGSAYGTDLERVTVILKYQLMVDILKKCPQTAEYYKLLSVLKAVDKSPALERELERGLVGYREIEKSVPYSEETGWANNEIGFMAYDRQGTCEMITLWISYDLAFDMIFAYGDNEIIRELKNTHDATEKFVQKLKERLDKQELL